ncbi:hypothetical protein [Aliarcobacter cryaerophilus]|uniref:hypothetical protein n=1 Tax=Aliarcobacter cryaerophilus TaxID=28198 RepID=UPI0013FD768D|nr:hypothetical protein [Aliarcobacter cryaerophilus]
MRKIGKITNNTKEGITNQKIEYESFEIVSTFFVSTYIQIKANTDTKGIDAKIAPTNELLFESSDIGYFCIKVLNGAKSLKMNLNL